MYDTNTERPNLDEQYISATNASNLVLHAERTGPVDHLIAAGLVGNRMGSILIHLVGEWTAADKPPKPTEADAAFRAELVFAVLGHGHKGKPDVRRARTEVLNFHNRAMRAIYMRLPSRPIALAIMLEWAEWRNVDLDLLSPALYHHLNPTCPVCDGLGHLKMPEAPVLGKQCHHCAGSGSWPRPLGADRVHQWLAGCGAKARAQRGNLMHGRADVIPMAERLRGDVRPDDAPEEVERVAEVFRLSMARKSR